MNAFRAFKYIMANYIKGLHTQKYWELSLFKKILSNLKLCQIMFNKNILLRK